MEVLLWVALATVGLSQCVTASDLEMLTNPDFEDNFARSNWWGHSCTVASSTDSFSGLRSAKVTKREKLDSFLRQDLTLAPGVRYLFSAHVKLLSEFNKEGHLIQLSLGYQTDKNYRAVMCSLPNVKISDLWVKCSGDFLLPEGSFNHKVMIRVADNQNVKFLVDKTSLSPLLEDADWEVKANERIRANRQGTLQLSIVSPVPYDHDKVRLQIKQLKHKFPFGSAIDTRRLFDDWKPENIPYRNYFYDMFNWAVFKNDVKWRFMEPTEGDVIYENIDRSLSILDEKGIPVRAHCVSWGKEAKVPKWLKKKKNANLKSHVIRRINYLTEHYKGRFAHWDVNNEDLHGRYYEEHTGNPQFLQSMLMEMHNGDPEAMLFTNDYEVTERSDFISAYKRQVMNLISDGAPIHGIGVQAHYFDYPDVHLLQHHLDELSTVGLPIWISELHYDNEDVEKRADGYEDFLRMAFSHPGVEGIIQWDFWDGSMQYPKASLVDGLDFKENAAGKRFRKLIKEEWHSSLDVTPADGEQDIETKLFYGDYEVSLFYDGEELWKKTMQFSPTTKVHKLHIVVGAPFDQMSAVKKGIKETKNKDKLMAAIRGSNLLDLLRKRVNIAKKQGTRGF